MSRHPWHSNTFATGVCSGSATVDSRKQVLDGGTATRSSKWSQTPVSRVTSTKRRLRPRVPGMKSCSGIKLPGCSRCPSLSGIFTWATTVGRELLEACRLANLSVPYEVAVLGGNDDELLCDASYPSLSGINVPAEQIGHEAARILDRMMHGGKAPVRPLLLSPSGVVARRSTDTLAIDDPDVVQALEIIRAKACSPMQMSDILRVVPVSRSSLERKIQASVGALAYGGDSPRADGEG